MPREIFGLATNIRTGKEGVKREMRWTTLESPFKVRRDDVHGYVVHGADQASFRVIRSNNDGPPSTVETTTIHARDFLVCYLLPRSNAIHGSPLFVIQRRRFHFDVIDARYDPRRLCRSSKGKGVFARRKGEAARGS